MNKAILFTDGACKGNPGPGGWGVVFVSENGQVNELGGREEQTTNNQMELQAAINGLTLAIQDACNEVAIYSDSSYVINGITKWVHGWKKKNWMTATHQPVLNKQLWMRLDELVALKNLKLNWHYVGGHIGVAGNERVDVIACAFAENKKINLYSGPLENYTINISNFHHNQLKLETKTSTRSRSSQKAYSYVSEIDGVIQIHKTWAECEARVKGKKARYKKAFLAQNEREIVEEFRKK